MSSCTTEPEHFTAKLAKTAKNVRICGSTPDHGWKATGSLRPVDSETLWKQRVMLRALYPSTAVDIVGSTATSGLGAAPHRRRAHVPSLSPSLCNIEQTTSPTLTTLTPFQNKPRFCPAMRMHGALQRDRWLKGGHHDGRQVCVTTALSHRR
jgi:hypothetical protein